MRPREGSEKRTTALYNDFVALGTQSRTASTVKASETKAAKNKNGEDLYGEGRHFSFEGIGRKKHLWCVSENAQCTYKQTNKRIVAHRCSKSSALYLRNGQRFHVSHFFPSLLCAVFFSTVCVNVNHKRDFSSITYFSSPLSVFLQVSLSPRRTEIQYSNSLTSFALFHSLIHKNTHTHTHTLTYSSLYTLLDSFLILSAFPPAVARSKDTNTFFPFPVSAHRVHPTNQLKKNTHKKQDQLRQSIHITHANTHFPTPQSIRRCTAARFLPFSSSSSPPLRIQQPCR